MLKPLAPRTALEWIASHLVQSGQSWHVLAYHKPLHALVTICSAHHLEADEPGMLGRMEKDSRELVEAFSSGSKDFVVFPSLGDGERSAIVEAYIAQLPGNKQNHYMEKWQRMRESLLPDWRPFALYRLFDNEEDTQDWENGLIVTLEPVIREFLGKNGISLEGIHAKYLR